ncbi:hypothetical protein L3Q82_010521 [Scortum barcoo]|uniref:Uncharacterized protein n=1 Tax=Scortum barcoo TaxID=214431 RepID=A0ACB8WCB4_9TELE|nr:hypothetical protein L3Q82_010521 [Scortum barcoo]
MDRRPRQRNQACWPMQCKPAQVPPRPIEPPSDPVIQGLRDALTKAISEIKSLKLENTELKEKIGLYHEQHVQVINLQEELRKKDELLKREQKKRQMRSKAHLETLHHLTIKQKEHVQHELKLRSKIEALEANIITKDHQLVQVINLQEKLKEKDELLKREQKKREMRSKAHLETLHRLTIMENEHAQHELKWRSKIEALEANIITKDLQLQELNNSNEQRQLEAKAEKEEEETKIDKEQEENKEGDSEKKDKEKMEREEKALIEKEVQKTKTKKRKRKKKRAP